MNVLLYGKVQYLAEILIQCLEEKSDIRVIQQDGEQSLHELIYSIKQCDFLFFFFYNNLYDPESSTINRNMIEKLLKALKISQKKVPIVLVSSAEADGNTAYSGMYRECEEQVISEAAFHGYKIYIYRLNNLFGRECSIYENQMIRRVYDSILYHEEKEEGMEQILYFECIDDVVESFCRVIEQHNSTPTGYIKIYNSYHISMEQLIGIVEMFGKLNLSKVSNIRNIQLITTLVSMYTQCHEEGVEDANMEVKN